MLFLYVYMCFSNPCCCCFQSEGIDEAADEEVNKVVAELTEGMLQDAAAAPSSTVNLPNQQAAAAASSSSSSSSSQVCYNTLIYKCKGLSELML